MGDDAGAAAVGKIGIGPLEQYGSAVAEADQKNEVNKQPRQPRWIAGQPESAHLRDSGGTANGRHRAFIPILERRTRRRFRVSVEFGGNDFRNVFTLFDGLRLL